MDYRKSEAKEAARAQFRGLWAAITTPFTADGALDEAGLRGNLRHLAGALGVEGVFCTGTMGEFWALTREERKRVVEIVVEEGRGRYRVIAHTGHHSAHETVELTRHAQEVGADFAVVINPYYPPADEGAIYEWFRFVAARVEIGLGIFDTGYSGYGFSPELTARIAEIENVCGIKLGGRSLEHYAAVQRLVGERIVLSHPSEKLWLTLMRDYGQRVHMSSAAPYILQTAGWRPLRDYTELGLAGRFGEAERVSRELEPLRRVHEKWMQEPWARRRLIPIAYLKAWCELLGLAGGPVRPGLPQITPAEREALRSDLEGAGLLAKLPAAARAA